MNERRLINQPKTEMTMHRKHSITTVVAIASLISLAGCSDPAQEVDISTYPSSNQSFAEVDAEVGCGSNYSDAKKKDIFESQYKNHWFTWTGKVALADAGSVSIDIDGNLQDIAVDLAGENAGYDVVKDSTLTVRFLMKTPGGCFLPFSGEHGEIVD